MSVVLEVLEGPGKGRKFVFQRHDVFLLGRSPRCHFSVGPDKRASRIHIIIEVTPSICRMRDLGSTNGTYLNDHPVKAAEIKDGDIIRAGDSVLAVQMDRSADTSTEEPEADYTTDPGQVSPGFPGYRIVGQLPPGGMASLWLAEKEIGGRKVVIKTIRPDRAFKPGMRDLFLRESRISLDLRHPNIVDFIEAGEVNGEIFIVMEYVAGLDADRLRRSEGGKLSSHAVVEIGLQALMALAHAHQAGVVHRDMKPANILIQGCSPDDYHAKIADFGLAKHYRCTGITSLTQTGTIRGSMPFMPPEQVTRCKDVDHRADIFSLGATLYNLLTDAFVYPFHANEDHILTIVQGKIVPLDHHPVSISPALRAVIHRALESDPDKRYSSAREMRTALQQAK